MSKPLATAYERAVLSLGVIMGVTSMNARKGLVIVESAPTVDVPTQEDKNKLMQLAVELSQDDYDMYVAVTYVTDKIVVKAN